MILQAILLRVMILRAIKISRIMILQAIKLSQIMISRYQSVANYDLGRYQSVVNYDFAGCKRKQSQDLSSVYPATMLTQTYIDNVKQQVYINGFFSELTVIHIGSIIVFYLLIGIRLKTCRMRNQMLTSSII